MNFISLDIETIPGDIDNRVWTKFRDSHEHMDSHAGLYGEFGQIVCVGMTVLNEDFEVLEGREKAWVASSVAEERKMLNEIQPILDKAGLVLVGHAIKMFDIPFMAKRFIHYGLKLPSSLQTAGKKPWDLIHVDTMELMKFGGFTPMSLDSACLLLGLSSPKEGCCGEDVWDMFKRGELDNIAQYCLGDTRASAGVARILYQLNAFN